MNKKLFLIFAVVSLFLLLAMQNVYALGITPGRATVNFEPGLKKDISFSVINTEKKDMSVVIAVRGELGQYITLNKAYEDFLSAEESKSFIYTVQLPQRFDKPGVYSAEIVALELPKNFKESGSFVGSTVSVISQLDVYVPYPNKYVEADANVIESEGKINFIIPAINRGKLDIVNIKAVIDIYTALNEKVTTIETNVDSLNSLERKELSAEWTPNVNSGKYLAVITVIYDNEQVVVNKPFNIGEELVNVIDVVVRDFALGDIAKFNALVENKWSNPIKDVFLNILVFNNEGEIMADFKSPTYNLDALAKSEIVAFWDTAGVHVGTYDGKLLLKYGEKSVERNIQLKIGQNDLEIIGLTGHVLVKNKGGKLNINNLLVIVVIVLVVANIVWFVLIRKILKKKR